MISADPLRDITNRGIGIYSDPDCEQFQYTTGAFINDGKYGDVFYTECPVGNRLANPDQVNFALLRGSAQEGYFNLAELTDGADATALFWKNPQLNQTGVGELDWIHVTKYAATYGGRIVDGTLNVSKTSPEGHPVIRITVLPTDRIRLSLGGVRDGADPTITFRRIIGGESFTVGLVWANNAYRSGTEAGIYNAAMAAEGYYRIIDIEWN